MPSSAHTTLQDRIEAAVRDYPDWSRAERRRMDDVVEDVLQHCRDGNGNAFIRQWCERHLAHLFA